MDFVLLGICALYFVRGCWKGFLSMLFSLAGIFVVGFLAYELTQVLTPLVNNFAKDTVCESISNIANGIWPGTFSNMEDFQAAVSASKFGVLFSVLFSKIIPNITFDGGLTAGQILAPTLCVVLLKVLTFVALFILLEIVLKLLRFLLNKLIKKCGLSVGNRILGGLLGLVKGLAVFAIIYFVLTVSANVFLNEGFLQFVQSGQISNFIYQNVIVKIIETIY